MMMMWKFNPYETFYFIIFILFNIIHIIHIIHIIQYFYVGQYFLPRYFSNNGIFDICIK